MNKTSLILDDKTLRTFLFEDNESKVAWCQGGYEVRTPLFAEIGEKRGEWDMEGPQFEKTRAEDQGS